LDLTATGVQGNKVDLEQNREVPTQEAKALAEKLKIPFFETSAKERINLVEAFAELVRQVDRYREGSTFFSLSVSLFFLSRCCEFVLCLRC
jgi:Fe2+ transport system protein B